MESAPGQMEGASLDKPPAGTPERQPRPSPTPTVDAVPVVTAAARASAYAIALCALVANAGTGLAFAAVRRSGCADASFALLISWRLLFAALWLLPYTVVQLWRSTTLRRALAQPHNARLVACAGVAWWAHNYPFAMALEVISVATALLFCTLSPLVLLGWRALGRRPISPLEAAGAVIAVGGSALLALASGASVRAAAQAGGVEGVLGTDVDPGDAGDGGLWRWPAAPQPRALAAQATAFAAAIGGAIYFVQCGAARAARVDGVVLFAACNVVACALCVPALALLGPGTVPLDASLLGLFGFARPAAIGPIAIAALTVDVLGNLGYIVALRALSPLTVSVIILLQPLLAQAYAVLLQGEAAPSPLGAAAMLITIVGVFCVVRGEAGAAAAAGAARDGGAAKVAPADGESDELLAMGGGAQAGRRARGPWSGLLSSSMAAHAAVLLRMPSSSSSPSTVPPPPAAAIVDDDAAAAAADAGVVVSASTRRHSPTRGGSRSDSADGGAREPADFDEHGSGLALL